VLRDGRVIVSGGEYSDAGSETNKTEMYDPATNTWKSIDAPTGWTRVGDAACAVLADGRLLMGNLDDTRTAIFDPVPNKWSAGPAKGKASDEESWVLMPDGSVVTVRCDNSKKSEKYVPATNTWVDAGTLPQVIVEVASSEIGAGVLLTNGTAFFAGANGKTALYSPPLVVTNPGTWTAGPAFPNDSSGQTVGCKDSPSCLMTHGRVLVSAGPVNGGGTAADYLTPTYFYEFNGTSFTRVTDPPNSTREPYRGRMMLLPTGEILYAAETDAIYAYSYFSCPDSSWRPQITFCPAVLDNAFTYSIQGRGFNGLSQAVGYGDDASSATNYPLVRLRHKASGHVSYCKTFNHSTTGVATGNALVSTNFIVPWNAPLGATELSVVANGIASEPVQVTVDRFVWRWPLDAEQVNRLIGSLADGPLWVLGPNGPVPVDPWPKLAKEAAAARDQILAGVKALQKLGAKIEADRLQAAAAEPPVVDDHS
jgi:hypothetical protein